MIHRICSLQYINKLSHFQIHFSHQNVTCRICWIAFMDLQRFFIYSFFNLLLKKLFDLPVQIDFASDKAFNAAEDAFLFQMFFRIRFFVLEVRFFGTAATAVKKQRGYMLCTCANTQADTGMNVACTKLRMLRTHF